MVFIHGGAFLYGAGSLPIYDGSYLAASGDVVVVTLNYRLGALGFLAVPELGLTGNYGILDQRLALRWVAENIASFGGDPRQVTIFGESAGAMSVGLHLFSIPENRGRFRAAIMESNPLALPYPSLAAQLEVKWQQFLSALCFETNQSPTCTFDLAALRALPLATLETADGDYTSPLDVFGRLQAPMALAEVLPWTPIIDGQIFAGDTLIQNQPYQGFYDGPNGTAGPKPYLIGVNRDEGALFADLANQGAVISPVAYQSFLAALLGTTATTTITNFTTAGGARPYDPTDQGTQPPWFANSGAAAAASNLLDDFLFRCGTFLPPTVSSPPPAPSRSTPTCSPRPPSSPATARPPAPPSPPSPAARTPATASSCLMSSTPSPPPTPRWSRPPTRSWPGGSRAPGPASPAPSTPAPTGSPTAPPPPPAATTSRS